METDTPNFLPLSQMFWMDRRIDTRTRANINTSSPLKWGTKRYKDFLKQSIINFEISTCKFKVGHQTVYSLGNLPQPGQAT